MRLTKEMSRTSDLFAIAGVCVIAVVTLGMLLESCEAEAQEAQRSYPFRLACVGDSITLGHYPEELQKLFGDSAEIRVYAREGAGAEEILEYALDALDGGFEPTHVLWYAGINDCACQRRTRQQEWRRVIEVTNRFVEAVERVKVEPVLIEHHPWDGSRYDPSPIGWSCSGVVNDWIAGERLMAGGAQVIDTSGLGYARIACSGRRNIEGCDRYGQLRDRYNAGDGLHLSHDGAKVLARMIYDQVDW